MSGDKALNIIPEEISKKKHLKEIRGDIRRRPVEEEE